MESKTQETQMSEVEVNNQAGGTITKIQPSAQSQEEWLKYGEQISSFLATLPEYLGTFYNKYKQPLIFAAVFVAAVVAVKVVLAVLDALNDIPLVAPSFELIGIGYSTWFVYRYLLKASTRKELTNEIQGLRSQVVGQNTSEA